MIIIIIMITIIMSIQRMWNLKYMIISVIIGATGTVTKGLKKNLGTIPRKHSADSPLRTAVGGTSHITRKVLQSET